MVVFYPKRYYLPSGSTNYTVGCKTYKAENTLKALKIRNSKSITTVAFLSNGKFFPLVPLEIGL